MKNSELKIHNSKSCPEQCRRIIIMIALCFLAGCQPSNTHGNKNVDYSPIAGTWESEDCPIIINIDESNKVESAVVTPGEVLVKPYQVVKVEVQSGEFASYEGGEFRLSYTPDNRYLEVEIEVKHLEIPFPEDKLEGSVKHSFAGFLSDNCNEWNSTWFEFFDYGPRFPMDPNDLGIPVKFKKIEK